jgi:hypothetical protein
MSLRQKSFRLLAMSVFFSAAGVALFLMATMGAHLLWFGLILLIVCGMVVVRQVVLASRLLRDAGARKAVLIEGPVTKVRFWDHEDKVGTNYLLVGPTSWHHESKKRTRLLLRRPKAAIRLVVSDAAFIAIPEGGPYQVYRARHSGQPLTAQCTAGWKASASPD